MKPGKGEVVIVTAKSNQKFLRGVQGGGFFKKSPLVAEGKSNFMTSKRELSLNAAIE